MIRLVEDVGAPATVVAIDIATIELAPDYNEMASYIMTVAGYAAGFFLKGRAGNFMTSMGVAAVPLAARAIRERVKGGMMSHAGTSRMAFRASKPIKSYPAQPKNSQPWPSAV